LIKIINILKIKEKNNNNFSYFINGDDDEPGGVKNPFPILAAARLGSTPSIF